MRRVLVLGGTAWLGREIARRAIEDGADVACLARGESGPVPDGARLVPADRRSPSAYDAVKGDWDEVVEIAHDPQLVGPALEALAARASHWTLVSSVSVYARNDEPDADESAAVVEPSNLSEYADSKVATLARIALADDAAMQQTTFAGDTDTWDEWWQAVAAVPRYADALARRSQVWGTELHVAPPKVTLGFHLEALASAGFVETGTVWQYLDDHVVYGVSARK